jgi:hypothetical protein
MAWPSSGIRTRTTGELETAARLNVDIRDALQSGAIAATVTALNALFNGGPADGARGFIRVGSSPFDVVALVYNGSAGKWQGEDPDLMVSLPTAVTSTATTYISAAAGPIMPHKVMTDAGLVLFARIQANATAGASSSTQVACLVSTGSAAGALTLDTTNVTGAATTSSATQVNVDGGWTAISGSITPLDVCSLSIGVKRTGAANGTANAGTALWMRWSS